MNDEQSWPLVPATPGSRYWIVGAGLLADEPARRSFIAHARRDAAERGCTGRIRFRRSVPNPIEVELGMPATPLHWIEVLPARERPRFTLASSYELTEPHGPTIIDGQPVPWKEAGRPEVIDNPGDNSHILLLDVACSVAQWVSRSGHPEDAKGWWILDGQIVPWHTAHPDDHHTAVREPKEGHPPVRIVLPVLVVPQEARR